MTSYTRRHNERKRKKGTQKEISRRKTNNNSEIERVFARTIDVTHAIMLFVRISGRSDIHVCPYVYVCVCKPIKGTPTFFIRF